MGRLKSTYGFTGAEWRAELARLELVNHNGAEVSKNERGSGRDHQRALLSPDEAAEFLGVHTQTVRGYIRTGKLPAYRLAGERALRIRREELLALLEPFSPEEADLSDGENA